jgi:hypothetical protein
LDLLPLGLGEDRANVSLGAVVNDFWSRGGTVFENSAVGEKPNPSVIEKFEKIGEIQKKSVKTY